MNEDGSTNRLEDWGACEGGELRQFVWRAKGQRRNRDMVKAGSAVVILLLCAFAATLIWQQVSRSGQNNYGGISCKEVKSHLSDLKAGKIRDVQLAKRLRIHLDKCAHCKSAYESMSDPAALSRTAPHTDACGCESCKQRVPRESYGDLLFAIGQTE